MSFKKKSSSEEGNSERWLLTYSDLITLLMVFFIVMYAMSTVNAAKYEQLKQSLGSALNPDSITASSGGNGNGNGSTSSSAVKATDSSIVKSESEEEELERVAEQLQSYLGQNGLAASVSVNVTERGVVVSLKDSVLFDPGSINIKPENLSKLVSIGEVLTSVDHYIRVEGNTDNIPMNNGIIKSNWELSVLRATQVLEVLVLQSGVSPDRISPIGYGEYRPVAPNDSPENRAKNRRVDIVVLSDVYNNSEAASVANPASEN